jgi:hypothetical protein
MKKPVIFLSLLASLIAAQSCTNLEEQVLDESFSPSISYADIANGTLAPVYALLPSIFLHTNYFTIQEISTDEAILPYRGGTDWGDNGIYLALHQHTSNKYRSKLEKHLELYFTRYFSFGISYQ